MARVRTFLEALQLAAPRPDSKAARDLKKNYAERLSRHLATLFATRLRKPFDGILPDDDGLRQESRARTAKGVKKLDVNYSTPELGLGLGVSIKTINFADPRSLNYSKNFTRVDNELRAEAMDYHLRQPFAVLVAVLFLPADACKLSEKRRSPAKQASSFGNAVVSLRYRARRAGPSDSPELFEKAFVALYEHTGSHAGRVGFFDVEDRPPRTGRPAKMLTLEQVIEAIVAVYDARNKPRMHWAGEDEPVVVETSDTDDEDDDE